MSPHFLLFQKNLFTFDEVQRADWLKIPEAASFLDSIRRIWEKHKTTRYKPDDSEEEQQSENHQKEILATIFEQKSSRITLYRKLLV